MSNHNIEAVYPLSHMQQGILFHSIYKPDSGIYTVQLSCPFDGEFNVTAFERAWQRVIDRHPILRTLFAWERRSKPLQIVRSKVELPWAQQDWQGLSRGEQKQRLEDFLNSDRTRGFELSQAPLLRLAVIRLDENHHQFIWTTHHLILDGWSSLKVIEEVMTFYEALCSDKNLVLKEPRPYGDYIAWLQRQDTSSARAFWQRSLSGISSPTSLLPDKQTSAASPHSVSDRKQQARLSAGSTAKLQAWSRRHGLTLNTLVHGAWALLLSRYSGEQDVIFGTTVSGRPVDLEGVESMVGLFINTLPLRVNLPSDEALLPWLKALQSQQAEMREYEYSSLVDIQGWSSVPRGQPLFNSFVVFENYPMRPLSNDKPLNGRGLRIGEPQVTEITNYPICFTAVPGQRLELRLSYDESYFNHSTIARMLTHLQALIEGMAAGSEARLRDMQLISEAEKHQLLSEWNDTDADCAQDTSLNQLIEAQVRRRPDAVAVAFAQEQLTYSQLDRMAAQLANYLRSLRVDSETLVGICLERSIEMLIGLLGVLKAGGAYVPLDPAYPPDRIGFVLEDTRMPVLLTERRLTDAIGYYSGHIVRLDADWPIIARHYDEVIDNGIEPENLAYVIYTSGSTGRPKGVQIEHRSVANFLETMRQEPGLKADDRLLAVTTLSFDIAGLELLLPLTTGGLVKVASRREVMDGKELSHLLQADDVTVMQATPANWRVLLEAGWKGSDQLKALCGGEALPQDFAGQLRARVGSLWNLYGPTETTIWSARAKVDDTQRPIGLGRPIGNTQIYILDRNLQPCPVDVVGDLYIAGAGLTRGYLNRAALTAEKLIPNPHGEAPGSRLYKTGDLARFRSDGVIEFFGRSDHQVKIRGYRIEPGEVEAALNQHPAVKSCVVMARENESGVNHLIAYWVACEGTQLSANAFRRFLQEKLPDYMIPSTFMQLNDLPLTPNGKLDRNSLPAPDQSRQNSEVAFTLARTQTEEALAAIWRAVLGIERVGINDNFFDLGGHSLLATQIISRVREVFRMELSLEALFESLTVSRLASHIEEAIKAASPASMPPLAPATRTQETPLSLAQQRLWFLDQFEPANPAYNIPAAVRLIGPANIPALAQSFNEVICRHEILRTTFESVAGQPVQVIAPARIADLPITDLSHLSPADRDTLMARLVDEEASRPFDLTCGPLVRLRLVLLEADQLVITCVMHHIISDGWSTGIFIREAIGLYESFFAGMPSPLEPLRIQFADFAIWQRNWLRGKALEDEIVYWKQRLNNKATVLDLPTDRPRPQAQTNRGATRVFDLQADLAEDIKALSLKEGCTLFMTLLAAFKTLLHYYTGQAEITVGTDVACRHRTELEGLIGFLANQLVLRTDVSGAPTFRDLMRRVRDVVFKAVAHQDVPFDKLVSELAPDRDLSRSPLFQVMMVLQNAPAPDLRMTNLILQPVRINNRTAKFDLVLFVEETEQAVAATWNYNTDLFDRATIDRMMSRFEILLKAVVAEPESKVDMLIEKLDQTEKEKRVAEQKKHEEAGLLKFKSVKPRMVKLPQASPVNMSCFEPDQTLPLVISPAGDAIDLAGWVKGNEDVINERLMKHGAVLFRGFNLDSVSDFERAAESLCPGLYSDYGDLPREALGKNIYGSTPYPSDQAILFHNESSHMHCWPMRIMFYCVQPPEQGGETPIVDCRKVYNLLDSRLRESFEKKNLMYVRHYIDGLDVSWQTFFRTTSKEVVEEQCRKVSVDLHWTSNNGLKTSRVCPAVVKHPKTGEMIFFNQLQLHHASCLNGAVRESLESIYERGDLPRQVYYGDGTPIEDDAVQAVYQLYKENSISFQWQKGDLLLLDNMMVAHGRNPYSGPRKIVVTMGEMLLAESLK